MRILRRKTGEMTMIAHRTAQVINMSRNVGKSDQADFPQPGLRMTWSIDPATSKLVGCWVVERAEAALSVPLSPAA
jgi:hypothetical protein